MDYSLRDNIELVTLFMNMFNLMGSFWSVTPDDFAGVYAETFNVYNDVDVFIELSQSHRSDTEKVRCFKDHYWVTFLHDNKYVRRGKIASWSKVPAEIMSEYLTWLTKTGYTFSWWAIGDGDEIFDVENDTVTTWMTLNAVRTANTYEVHYEAWKWTWNMENQTFTYDTLQDLKANTFTNTWYIFSGWTDWTAQYRDWQEVRNLTATSGDVITLTAEWTPIEYEITYDLGGWTESRANPTTYTVESWTFWLYQPTKTWYMFLWWTWTNWDTPNANIYITEWSTGDRIYNAVRWSFEDIDAYFISDAWAVSYITLMDRNLWASKNNISLGGSYGFHYQWWNNNGFEIWCSTKYCSDIVTTNATGRKAVWNDSYNSKWYNWVNFINWQSCYWDYWEWCLHYDWLRWWSGDDKNNGWWLNSMTLSNITKRQWPCPSGYHVPSIWEWDNLLVYWAKYKDQNNRFSLKTDYNDSKLHSIEKDSSKMVAYNLRKDFNIPGSETRFNMSAILWHGTNSPNSLANFWSSSVRWGSSRHFSLNFSQNSYITVADATYRSSRNDGLSIRCFENNYLFTQAPMTIDARWWKRAMILVEADKIKSLQTPSRDNSIFEGWYDADTWWNKLEIWNNAPANLYARWSCYPWYVENNGGTGCVKLYTITYELHDGVTSWENITWYTIESEDITLINPTKIWYTFTWRIGTELGSPTISVTIPSGSIWDRNYEANWQINQYTITFDTDWWTNIPSITADYWTWIIAPANPTKNGYTFKWRDREIPTTMPAENITIKAKWEKVSGWSSGWWGWGGGWGWSSSSSCKNLPTNAVANNNSTPSSNTNYYYSTNTSKVCTFQCKSGYTRNEVKGTCDKASDNQTASTWTNVKEPEGTWSNTKIETWNNTEIQTWNNAEIQTWSQEPLSPSDSSPDREQTVTPMIGGDGEARGGWTQTYSIEFQQAYEFAHENGITTKNTIESADMNGKLTRIAMAKMLSQYAINILWKTPDTSNTKKFDDVSDKRDADYDNWVTLAYQLWIMWQNMANNFRPDDEVTRAEFATALSRMLYNTSDWIYKSTAQYYVNHMKKLKEEWIITKDDPKMKELRWYVMIMLMRSAK